jgi:hypothetical protein
MKHKKFSNDVEMKKLLNELSTKEASKVKGGNAPAQGTADASISVGIRINF